MRSLRSRFELACRLGAFAVVGWMLGTSVFPSRAHRVDRASQTDIESRLADWTRAPSAAIHGEFSATPSLWAVDWLSALRHSGRAVTWSGSPAAIALSAEPLADPRGTTRVDVAAPSGAAVDVHDDASAIGTVKVGNLGGTITTPLVAGRLAATSAGESAIVPAPDSLRLRSIAVVGAAGWEGKFIVAALEERGWPVIARFAVAPKVDVTAQNTLVLDTSRVSAVVVVDTSVQSLGADVERFVRSGGGLILAGPAALGSLSALAPGIAAPRVRPATLPSDTIGLGSTGFYPVANLKSDAVVLERRPAGVSMAARRVGAGRVIQMGYDDSWRWRMAGAPGSENAHREWWSRLVSSVAYAPPHSARPVSTPAEASSAPLASLVERLGPARASAAVGATGAPIDRRLLLAAVLVLLLAEWGSRRLRGLK